MQYIIIIHRGTILQKSKTDNNFEKVRKCSCNNASVPDFIGKVLPTWTRDTKRHGRTDQPVEVTVTLCAILYICKYFVNVKGSAFPVIKNVSKNGKHSHFCCKRDLYP